jgi:hemerythrin-like domain-containing protein
MDAIQFLKQQHEEAKGGFGKIEAALPEQRERQWKALKPELPLHEEIEETCLYHLVAREPEGKSGALARWETRHHEQVQQIEALIRRLEGLEPRSSEWLQQLKKIKSTLEGHIREEEQEVWPRIQEILDHDRLEQAGREMERMKASKLGHVA